MNFRKITLEDKNLLHDKCKSYQSAFGWEYDFRMMWIWNINDATMICSENDITYIYTIYENKLVFFPPYVCANIDINIAIQNIVDYCKQINVPLDIRGITKCMHDKIDTTRFNVITNRNDYDYIYRSIELAELPGKKFHSKRNFVNRFTSTYNFEFRDYQDSDYNSILELYDDWASKSNSSDEIEKKAIKRALEFHKELQLIIGVVVIDNNIVAFAISSIFNEKLAHSYFEKADYQYMGLSQTINNLMAKKYLIGCEFVNREEDMGIEGLRKAKESYNPVKLFEKYRIIGENKS